MLDNWICGPRAESLVLCSENLLRIVGEHAQPVQATWLAGCDMSKVGLEDKGNRPLQDSVFVINIVQRWRLDVGPRGRLQVGVP